MSASHFDISEFVGDVLHGDAVTPATLIDVARERGARPAVVDALRRLRRSDYRHLSDVLADLDDIPADLDPWDASGE